MIIVKIFVTENKRFAIDSITSILNKKTYGSSGAAFLKTHHVELLEVAGVAGQSARLFMVAPTLRN